jgi:RNA polymerase sigma-70 factor (ECF subfamily)
MSTAAVAQRDDTVQVFQAERPRLFGIAYRMTGSVAEAEDIVQDAWLRFAPASDGNVRSPQALLTTIVTRLSIDHMRSARVRREQYIGPWLPEPLHTRAMTPDDDPEASAIARESLDFAALALFERLSPVERAVLVLHEAFEMPHAEIASTIGISVAASRQHLRRARVRLSDGGKRYRIDPAEHDRVTNEFISALKRGDVAAMTDLLSEDVVVYTDGGGVAAAAPNPVYGRDRAMRFLLGLATKYPHWDAEVTGVNIAAGMRIIDRSDAGEHSISYFEVREGRIASFHVIRNPHNLAGMAKELAVR